MPYTSQPSKEAAHSSKIPTIGRAAPVAFRAALSQTPTSAGVSPSDVPVTAASVMFSMALFFALILQFSSVVPAFRLKTLFILTLMMPSTPSGAVRVMLWPAPSTVS